MAKGKYETRKAEKDLSALTESLKYRINNQEGVGIYFSEEDGLSLVLYTDEGLNGYEGGTAKQLNDGLEIEYFGLAKNAIETFNYQHELRNSDVIKRFKAGVEEELKKARGIDTRGYEQLVSIQKQANYSETRTFFEFLCDVFKEKAEKKKINILSI